VSSKSFAPTPRPSSASASKRGRYTRIEDGDVLVVAGSDEAVNAFIETFK